jgi:hypothetical protein
MVKVAPVTKFCSDFNDRVAVTIATDVNDLRFVDV